MASLALSVLCVPYLSDVCLLASVLRSRGGLFVSLPDESCSAARIHQGAHSWEEPFPPVKIRVKWHELKCVLLCKCHRENYSHNRRWITYPAFIGCTSRLKESQILWEAVFHRQYWGLAACGSDSFCVPSTSSLQEILGSLEQTDNCGNTYLRLFCPSRKLTLQRVQSSVLIQLISHFCLAHEQHNDPCILKSFQLLFTHLIAGTHRLIVACLCGDLDNFPYFTPLEEKCK